MDCNEQIFQPTNDTPILCDGDFKSTECILTPVTLPYINVAINSSQLLINQNLVLALQNANQLISDLEERITALEA